MTLAHWFVIAVIPEVVGERIEEEVKKLLDPLTIAYSVRRRKIKCSCVGDFAKEEVWKAIDTLFTEKFDNVENAFEALGEWRHKNRERFRRMLKRHPLRSTPDPDCDLCSGDGYYYGTSNPKGIWYNWTIGGVWGRAVTGESPKESYGNIEENVAPVRAILREGILPYALVTPDGKAHTKWDDEIRLPLPEHEWRRRVMSILSEYVEGYIGVGADCVV